jgi:hypothetical protein
MVSTKRGPCFLFLHSHVLFHWKATIARKYYGIVVNEYENISSVSNNLGDFRITYVLMKNDECHFKVSYV